MSSLQSWELENNVVTINDDLFRYDINAHNSIVKSKPWVKDVHYFKYIRVSAHALLKMVTHARRGGNLEVMGMLFGKVTHNTMIVMDSVALPVEGTETRVNAQSEAYEFITMYKDTVAKIGRTENVIGWYHSHPGYGCWLSGIDVTTQTMNQTYQDPFVAVVLDPVRTVSSGKVNIGAFRTYPRHYSPPDQGPSEYQSIPLNKIEDFGVHCKQYYPLVMSYFKSSLDKSILDILWNRYWTSTLTSSSILSQPDYMAELTKDLAEKVASTDRKLCQSGMHKFDIEEEASKVSKDAAKLANEELAGLMGQLIKYDVFNQ